MKRECDSTEVDLQTVARACRDVFSVRSHHSSGFPVRTWPPSISAYGHWKADYQKYATEVGLDVEFGDAISELREWVEMLAIQ